MQISIDQVQKMLDWFKNKLFLNSISAKSKNRVLKRGQVYRCNFGCGIGSEMQKERPAVIVQNDIGNLHSSNTIVVPITHDTSTLPCVASLTPQSSSDGTILLDGQANTSNIMCVSKARIGNYITSLPPTDMRSIDVALAKALNLMGYYSDLKKKIEKKNTYIENLKFERNNAQDALLKTETTLQKTIDVNNKIK